jgi:hypothetical protein
VILIPAKVDFKKTLKELYQPNSKEVVEINVPEMQFLMVDGMGSPGEAKEYLDALAILYPVAYKIKFLSKVKGKDYVVPPLEGLWWADNVKDFIKGYRNNWKWTMMIMIPKWIDSEVIKNAIDDVKEKKPELKELLPNIKFEKFEEGRSAQIMHIGPYSKEGPTIQKVHEFIKSKGKHFDGHKNKHHEIYLSDPRKANPEKMKTIIRQSFI